MRLALTLAVVAFTTWVAVFAVSLYYVDKYPGGAALALAGDGAAADPPDARCSPVATGRAPSVGRTRIYAYYPAGSETAALSLGRDCG
ncbi:MAG: hypothetical protein CVT83_07510, partial [Alphaproteobacteria bacterium HGW-Alphaproteobacteria-5]